LLDKGIWERVKIDMELAIIHVVLGVRLASLVVVDHLDHLKEIVLGEALQALGEFLHVNLYWIEHVASIGIWQTIETYVLLLLAALLFCRLLDAIFVAAGGFQSSKKLALGVAERLSGKNSVSVEG
jgi:hypothetical protein